MDVSIGNSPACVLYFSAGPSPVYLDTRFCAIWQEKIKALQFSRFCAIDGQSVSVLFSLICSQRLSVAGGGHMAQGDRSRPE